jgi:hypothetical protein
MPPILGVVAASSAAAAAAAAIPDRPDAAAREAEMEAEAPAADC